MGSTNSDLYDLLAQLLNEVDDTKQARSAGDIRGKRLITDIKIDSLDTIKFILLVEERTSVKITDEDIESHQLYEIDRMVDFLSQRRQAAG
jgi:acyl carrier protein